jgi:hypothetical protein
MSERGAPNEVAPYCDLLAVGALDARGPVSTAVPIQILFFVQISGSDPEGPRTMTVAYPELEPPMFF